MADSFKLSKRLMMVYRLLGMGNVICDVGTDHGYLVISLIESKRYNNAIAMDINERPLSRAKRNIIEAGLTSLIDTRLSDGVKSLKTGEADAISISGLGGNVMIHIFDEGHDVISKLDTIVIQPQSEYAYLRKCLSDKGYSIIDEDIVSEDNKFYFAWKMSYTDRVDKCTDNGTENPAIVELNNLNKTDTVAVDKLSHISFCHSPMLFMRRDMTYKNYLMHHNMTLDKAIDSIRNNSSDTKRLDELTLEQELINEIMAEYYC